MPRKPNPKAKGPSPWTFHPREALKPRIEAQMAKAKLTKTDVLNDALEKGLDLIEGKRSRWSV